MIVFHHPKSLEVPAVVASVVRPMCMARAFREIGQEVVEVTGDGDERIRRARDLERRLSDPAEAADALLYAESVNVPPALTWLRRRPWRLNFDYSFLQGVHDRGVPTGLFYRDIHWILGRAKAKSFGPRLRHFVTPFFARHELRRYRRCLDLLFLPHEAMMRYLPADFPADVCSLPPGGWARPLAERNPALRQQGRLRLVYVGNIAPPIYDLRPYLEALESVDCAEVQLVTRARALGQFGHLYDFDRKPSVTVCEAHGDGLVPYYQEAEVAFTTLGQDEYLSFAMPVKVFEAISFGVPQIVSAGLEVAARLIEEENLGWVVQGPGEFAGLLRHLAERPEEVARKRESVLEARSRHSWQARAREVVAQLTTRRQAAGQSREAP